MNRRLVLISLWAAALVSCSPGPVPTEAMVSAPPIELMLARLDQGRGTVAARLIEPYVEILDRLETRCTEPRIRVSAMAVAAVAELKHRYGEDRTSLMLLENAAEGLERVELARVRCQDALAAVVVQIGERSREVGGPVKK